MLCYLKQGIIMEIKITTSHVLKALQIVSWIIFIGLCLEAGIIAANIIVKLFVNTPGVKYYWQEGDYLSQVYSVDRGNFVVIAVILFIVAVLKAILFYLIVKLFTEKKLRISQPFNEGLRRFIVNAAYLALGIAFFTHYGYKYTSGLVGRGIKVPDLQALHIAGADVWLFMAVVLFVIVQVVKKGIEIQTENDLTI